jgi:low affinity Fe/Cu permease
MSTQHHRSRHHFHHETLFARLARWATDTSGSTTAFFLAVFIIIAWLATGPIFGYSDTWQLVINTGTTVVTFLMVFLIQRAQNKDARAVHLKLNELVAAVQGASNRLINAENLTEEELEILHAHYGHLLELARAEGHITDSHSVEEAAARHMHKHRKRADSEPQR